MYTLKKHSHFAQFQPATRTQMPKAGFPAPARPCIANLSATTVAKHARKFGSQFKMGFPPKPNTENIIQVWKHFRYQAFRPHYEMGNGPQLTTLPFFSFKVIPDFPTNSSCPPQSISPRTLNNALDRQGIDKRHDSFLGEVLET